MNYIISEIIIPRGNGNEEIFSPQRIKISLRNEGAGNYIAVESINDEPNDDESAHEMYFENDQQIDDFTTICKKLLKGNQLCCQ